MFTRRSNFSARELTVFALLGALMYLTTAAVKVIPNVHLLGLFIAATTLTYRARALIPLYVYIFLEGLFRGFSMWWAPYLYVWLPLWLIFMALGKLKLPRKLQIPLYMVLCGLHGLAFGILYAPAHALMFGLSFNGMIAWIIAGLPFDITHAIGNFVSAALVIPLSELLNKLERGRHT